jgi:tRNA(Ile)-lysidine synthase
MKFVLAVSGGVDSVVLLHKFWKKFETNQLVVAHFDHGMRTDSAADARFVESLASLYGLPFELERQELGACASEATARRARYGFLKNVAKKHDATIVVAHHADDVVETIAINLQRGTGWRGLAVMGDQSIQRPLLRFSKAQLIDYALKNRLEWVEDETNQTTLYLRNRLRKSLHGFSSVNGVELGNLRTRQLTLARQIQDEIDKLLSDNQARMRYFLININQATADEMLRTILTQTTGNSYTRPQRSRMLLFVKVGRAGSRFALDRDYFLSLTAEEFKIESIKTNYKMIS